MPLVYSPLLGNELNWTDLEYSIGKKWLKWEEMTINWSDVNLTWDEIFLLLEVESVIRGGGGYGMKEYIEGNPWKQINKEIGTEKTKKIIKVYCKVNGLEYEDSKTPIDDIKLSVNEFERFIKEAISIKVNI